jgi:hypothetical protein
MSIAGNYTPEVWENGTTLLNTITMTKVTDAIKALDEIASRSLDINLFDDRDYFYLRNMKMIEDFYANYTATNASTTLTYDTSIFCLNDRSTRVTENDNTISDVSCYRVDSTDLETFGDGSESTLDDFIVIAVYISDKTKFNYISCILGENSTNFYYHIVDIDGNANVANGWNVFKFKKSDFLLSGSAWSGGWGTCPYHRIDARSVANAQNEYCCFQWMGMVRVDPDDADDCNIFQKYDGNNFNNVFINSDDKFYITHIDFTYGGLESPAIVNLLPYNLNVNELLLKENVKNFFGKFYWVNKKANYLPMITLFYDSNNFLSIYLENSVLKLYKKIDGVVTTFEGTSNITLAPKDFALYHIEKTNDVLRIRIKGGGQTFIETNLSEVDYLWSIYIGGITSSSSCNYGYLYDMIISNTNIAQLGSAGTIT